MAYFGGGGVSGEMHSSLKVYIDCFSSAPFPKGYPRSGGVWDQDPELMRDFRVIRDYEIQWKQTQESMRNLKEGRHPDEGGEPDLEDLLNDMIEEDGFGDDVGF